jgi:hypothetical protein
MAYNYFRIVGFLLGMLCASVEAQQVSQHTEIRWVKINLGVSNPNESVSPFTIPYANMDAQNPCRRIANVAWDLRNQIEYYKSHAEVYGNFYTLTADGYIKTQTSPPTEYSIKMPSPEGWITTNLIPKMSWFRISGWVSAIIPANNSKLIFIETWDAIKRRRVGSYCLLHPKASQFTYRDYVDCLVFNQSKSMSYNGVDYDVVDYGSPDYINENTLAPKTNSPLSGMEVKSVEVGMATVDTIAESVSIETQIRPFDSTRLFGNFTLSLQVFVDNYNNAWPMIVSVEGRGLGIGIIGKTSRGNSSDIGKLIFTSENGKGHNWLLKSSRPLAVGKWHSVVVKKHDSMVYLIVDNSTVASQRIGSQTFPRGQKMFIADGPNPILRPEDTRLHGEVKNVQFSTK